MRAERAAAVGPPSWVCAHTGPVVDEPAAVRAGPRRRWTLPVLGLAVALLFGYVATHRYPVARPPEPSPVPELLRPPFGDGLPRVTGDRGAGPVGLRLLVSGPYPRVVDAHTGRVSAVPGLRLRPDDRARLQPVPGGMLATIAGQGAVRTRTLLLPTAGSRPVLLGEDVRAIPAWRGGDLLVSSYGPGGTSVRVADRTGRVRSRWDRPGLVVPLRDTAAGLVVARSATAGSSGADLLLLEPSSGRLRRELAAARIALAVGPASLAHIAASCGRDCSLTVTDLVGGGSRDYRTPDQGSPSTGKFSPDGRRLALAVPGQYLNGRLTIRPGFAAVLDLATGRVLRVPGVETPAERAADLSWSRTGSLVLGVWWEDHARVGVWSPDRPGDRLRVLPAEPPGDYRSGSVAALA